MKKRLLKCQSDAGSWYSQLYRHSLARLFKYSLKMPRELNMVLNWILPKRTIEYLKRRRTTSLRAEVQSYPILTEDALIKILTENLKLKNGDVVLVHSSISMLRPDFPYTRALSIIREIIGAEGTILMPTYPQLPSYEFLKSGQVFDIRNTPSFTGTLTEFARNQEGAIRSLHPTKSVCAIGPLAEVLTNSHHLSPYPYDNCSPYYKIMDYDGICIGLGVSTRTLSFVHCVDDALKSDFPVNPYCHECFSAKCIDYDGNIQIVKTYAHNKYKMNHNVPKYMRKYIPHNICEDVNIMGRSFFRAQARELFDEMVMLAKKGKTMYPRRSYKWSRLI
jgi:aminoglycoside 3-N-acetyltransferase